MTIEANIVLGDRRFLSKREHIAKAAASTDMFTDITVAVETSGRGAGELDPGRCREYSVRIARQRLKLIAVARRTERFGDPWIGPLSLRRCGP